MENTSHFFTQFTSLLTGDFTAISQIPHFHFRSEANELFLIGRVFNKKPEDLLPEYLKKGSMALKEIDGDFLMIIAEKQKVVFFRDRHGAGKQLFYTDKYCSTQLIDFTAIEGFVCKPDIESLFTFLSIGYIPSPDTSLVGIKKLAGGCMLTFADNAIKVIDLFDYQDYIQSAGVSKLSIDEATHEYERLHKKAISERIQNADKVGLLLSGGYDSGGNISALRDIYTGDIVSYSIGFKDNPWTELPLAKILSERYHSKHYEYEIDGSEIMDLPQIVGALGDPFQEGGLMVNYTAMRLVKNSSESPHVILGGDGNDQHFGTSGKELALHWKFKNNGTRILQKMLDIAGNNSHFEKDNIFFRTEFHNRKILHIQQSDTFGFTKHQLNMLNKIDYKIPAYRYLHNSPQSYTGFDHFYFCRNYLVDIKQVINEVILFKASKMADMFANEISFPYMSTGLYEFLKQMPVDYKFHGSLTELSKGQGKSKFLHKRYLKPKLPSEITERKKQGGFAPLPIFLKNSEQRKIIFGIIEKSGAVEALFDKKKIRDFLQQYNHIAETNGYWFWFKQVQSNQIINLLTLVVWWEIFIHGRKNIRSVFDLA
jgi:asparagine synthase (glutamine-hydrolysing)